MATVDDLYGSGTWEAMQQAFQIPWLESEHSQAPLPDGGVRVTVDWGEAGHVKIDHYPGRARVVSTFLTPDFQGQGVTGYLSTVWGDFWESLGIDYVEAGYKPETVAALLRTGAVMDDDRVVWMTSGPFQRRKEYAAYKRGEIPEPAWHAEV